jgi:hypothetical protein
MAIKASRATNHCFRPAGERLTIGRSYSCGEELDPFDAEVDEFHPESNLCCQQQAFDARLSLCRAPSTVAASGKLFV